MAKKAVNANLPGALAESIKSSIHALEVQINLLKQAIGAPAGKSAKVKEEEEPEEEVEEEEIEEEEETEEEPEEEEEVEEEEIDDDEAEQEEETEEEDDSAPTLKVLTNALKKFSNRGEKQKNKAMMILKKYKIKHVDDLPKSKYKEVLKQLK